MAIRRTPKVFNSTYRPPRQTNWKEYRALWPLLLTLGVFVGLYIFFHLPFFKIQNIQLVGSADTKTMQGLNNFKGVSIFSSSLMADVERLRDSDLLISSLGCKRGLPNTLRCTASVRTPALLWKVDSGSYLVDSSGIAYATSVSAPEGITTIEDRSNQKINLGQTLASNDIVTAYQTLNKRLADNDIVVTDLYITDSLYQVGVTVTGTADPTIKWHPSKPVNFLFVTTSPIVDQIATVLATIKKDPGAVTDHIDVRVPGYVYFK